MTVPQFYLAITKLVWLSRFTVGEKFCLGMNYTLSLNISDLDDIYMRLWTLELVLE